jgi:hypothetical protein
VVDERRLDSKNKNKTNKTKQNQQWGFLGNKVYMLVMACSPATALEKGAC